MCGIIGYIGKIQDIKMGIQLLRRLEYRGYDSSGGAWWNPTKKEIFWLKKVGKIDQLEREVSKKRFNFPCNLFIMQTRWATHGEPSDKNAHPHFDCKKEIFLVHNGIIENYKYLKEKLIKEGHQFISETDTEILSHLIEKYFKGNLEEAVQRALREIIGAYAILVISKKDPQKIVFARNSSPLILGLGEKENFLASDVPALLGNTRKVIYLDDGEIGYIKKDSFKIFNFRNEIRKKTIHYIKGTIKEAQKEGYSHFMLKEIMEQPEVLLNSQRGRIILEEGRAKLGGIERIKEKLREIEKIHIVACGTSYFAGLVGKYMLEEYGRIDTEAEIASEFRYRKPVLNKKTALLSISQSGETADTLAAIKEAKEKGILTLGIVNVVGSSIAREVDAGIYNHAGPEIGVASTKAFTSQIEILALLTLFLGRQRSLSYVMGQRIAKEIKLLPDLAKKVLSKKEEIKNLARKYKDFKNFLYIGRKYNFPVALEGALKLKEISYIHAEGYGAGEMKHGPIALIDENFPTFAISPKDSVYQKMLSNIEEIKARGGPIIALTTEGNEELKKLVDDILYIPKTLEMLTPIIAVLPFQLFAYFIAVLNGKDPDKPRNLAKSVTVE